MGVVVVVVSIRLLTVCVNISTAVAQLFSIDL